MLGLYFPLNWCHHACKIGEIWIRLMGCTNFVFTTLCHGYVKCLSLGGTGWRVYKISLNHFLQLYVNLQLSQKENFKKMVSWGLRGNQQMLVQIVRFVRRWIKSGDQTLAITNNTAFYPWNLLRVDLSVFNIHKYNYEATGVLINLTVVIMS